MTSYYCPTKFAIQNLGLIYRLFKIRTSILIHKNVKPIWWNGMDGLLRRNDAPLSVVTCEKHLGHVLSTNGLYVNFDNIIRDVKIRPNCLKRELEYLDNAAKCKLE